MNMLRLLTAALKIFVFDANVSGRCRTSTDARAGNTLPV